MKTVDMFQVTASFNLYSIGRNQRFKGKPIKELGS
jgi:hypothetical protein